MNKLSRTQVDPEKDIIITQFKKQTTTRDTRSSDQQLLWPNNDERKAFAQNKNKTPTTLVLRHFSVQTTLPSWQRLWDFPLKNVHKEFVYCKDKL